MGQFELSSPGMDAASEEQGTRYPEPPRRCYRLPELLRLAGLNEEVSEAG